jgi:cytochrome c-type biogenesis protein CcmH/NrfG
MSQMGPALGAVLFGLVLGALAALRLRRGAYVPGRAADLLEQQDIVADEQADLATDRARLQPEMYRERTDALAKEAARLAATAVPAEAVVAAGGSGVGFFWGAATMALVAFLVTSVQEQAQPAPAVAAPARGASFDVSEDMTRLAAKLEQTPDDVETLVQLGHLLLKAQAMREAHLLTERALQLDPGNVEARVHRAVVTSAMDPHKGTEALDAVLKDAPAFAEGWFFRGMLAMQGGDPEGAKGYWERFVAAAPDGPQKERIRGFLAGDGLQMPR